jgi:hypothetical protein
MFLRAADAPTCGPKLPPSPRKNIGSLEPVFVRRLKTPHRPYDDSLARFRTIAPRVKP